MRPDSEHLHDQPLHGPVHRDHCADVEAARSWQPGEWPLSAEERAKLGVIFNWVCREAEVKRDEHRARIRRTARWVGVEVAEHRININDATRRVEALASTCDTDGPGRLFILRYDEAVGIAESAFADGYRSRSVA
jgi:hypothetical protein